MFSLYLRENTHYAPQRDQQVYSVLYDPCINGIYKIMAPSNEMQYTKISCVNVGVHCVSKTNFSIIWCFSDRASYYRLVSSYQLNAHSLYSITIYMLHYNPQHVSSSALLILRRTHCIITASGIVTLCEGPYSTPVESGLHSAFNRHTVRPFTESDDTRGCNNKMCPPEDEQGTARNMLRIIM